MPVVPIIALDNVDYMTIAIDEKARIRDTGDNMPSVIFNVDLRSVRLILVVDQIRALIESGSTSVTDRDGDGITPVHLAVITGKVPACAYLIERGREVNVLGGIVRKLHASAVG